MKKILEECLDPLKFMPMTLYDTLETCLGGYIRLWHQKEQVLQSQPSLIISYSSYISGLLGRDTALCNTIGMVKDAAQETFFDILKTRGEKLLRYPPPIAVDLSPPPAVREGVSLTLEIIENYNNSLMDSASGEKPAFDPVLSALLDPIIKMCEQAAEAHKSKMSGQLSRRSRTNFDSSQLTSVDALLSSPSPPQNNETPAKIFLINCLSAIQQPLLRHDVASQYVANIISMIENHINLLVQKEVDTLLQKCGLSFRQNANLSLFHNRTSLVRTTRDITRDIIRMPQGLLRPCFGKRKLSSRVRADTSP